MQWFIDQKPSHINAKKIRYVLAIKLGIQTCQILTNDDEVCTSSLSSILIAVTTVRQKYQKEQIKHWPF